MGEKLHRMSMGDLRRVRRAAGRVAKARAELREAIWLAVKSGESYRDIASYAELSHSRVAELYHEAVAAHAVEEIRPDPDG